MSSGVAERNLAIMKAIVIGRLVDPGSECYTKAWAESRSALYELTGKPTRNSLNSHYRATDMLFRCKLALETHLSAREKELSELPEMICFFDLTNTYLEGQALSNPKAKCGRSKEKRSDCKLQSLALIIDEHGFAKYSQLYSGSQIECETLEQMIESLRKMRPGFSQEQTVIIDAGIATKDNIKYLKWKELLHYIVVNRGKGEFKPDDTGGMRVVFQDKDRDIKIEI